MYNTVVLIFLYYDHCCIATLERLKAIYNRHCIARCMKDNYSKGILR